MRQVSSQRLPNGSSPEGEGAVGRFALPSQGNGVPPLVLLLLVAAAYQAWQLAPLLGQRYGTASRVGLMLLTIGPLLALSLNAYRAQQASFAERHWTAGAMAWMGPMIAAVLVLLCCLGARQFLQRRG